MTVLPSSTRRAALDTSRVLSRLKRGVALGLALALGAWTAPQEATAQTTVAGVTSGALSVDETGSAGYTLPIAVPPGIAGMQPSVALVYQSHGGNGTAGVGWGLSASSSIHRCAQTLVQDGAVHGVDFSADDRFCLDGQRLVAINGSYGADGTEYRTEIESFARITSHGSAGSGPLSFTVETKAGRTLAYGATTDSRLGVPGKDEIRLWSLNKVSDTSGNAMTYYYVEDTTDSSYRLDRIEYTRNDSESVLPQSEVRFLYEARPDTRTSYLAGAKLANTKRLSTVETWTDGGSGLALVKSYTLAYETSPATSRSRLTAVTECDAGSNCLLPVSLDWAGNSSLTFAHTSLPIPSGQMNGGSGLQFGDWNGDGITDAMWYDVTSGANQWFVNDGSLGFTTTSTPVDATLINNGTDLYFHDWNGDGVTDFLWYNRDSGNNWWFVNDGNLNFTPVTQPIPSGQMNGGSGLQFGDWNGDGITDAMWYDVTSGANQWFVNDGSLGFTTTSGAVAANLMDNGTELYFHDWNADGITDFLWYNRDSGNNGWFVNDGNLNFTRVTQPIPSGHLDGGNGLQFGDWNGDGITDAMWYDVTSGANMWFVNDGNLGFTTTSSAVAANLLDNGTELYFHDWNADGATDFLWYNRDSGNNGWFVNDGNLNFTRVTQPIASGQINNGNGLQFGDWNGDGITDAMWYNLLDGSNQWFLNNSGVPDLLTSITDSLGRVSTIAYAPLTDGTVYTKDSDAVFPVVDIQAPLYVVKSVSSDDGVGGQKATSYSYAGAKVHVQGRGFRGFRRMTATDAQTGLVTTTDYSQAFPTTAQVVTSVKELADGTTLKTLANTWDELPLNGGATVWPYVASSVSEDYEPNDGPGNTPVVSRTATAVFDSYGNPTNLTTTTTGGGGESFTETTVNTYLNDPTRWFLGLVTRSEVTRSRAGGQ